MRDGKKHGERESEESVGLGENSELRMFYCRRPLDSLQMV